ncbi:hypothetical protein E3V39_12555 [Gammaproteobacteria bacterium LSUCC0112]|nr:hypothetical protein E3V39_12555 [Gammaproteobacteria bacterium LSUCC0112]
MKSTHDSLGRRTRFKRVSEGTNHRVLSRDIAWFSFLHRHGGRLPTSYLFNATKDTHRSFQVCQVRLKHLYQELKLIDRPWQQEETIDPRYNELIHELNEKSRAVLLSEGLLHKHAPSPNGSFKHQVMLSCISASFELNAKEAGLTYIPQHEVVTNNYIEVEGDKVSPDGVFMLEIGGKKLLVFLEVDRGTEATFSDNFNRKSWKRSIRQYRQIIGHGLYKKRYGVECGALLLVVTISRAKELGILNVIEQEFDKGCNYMMVTHLTEFGRVFHPPKVLDMLGIEWQRSGHQPFKFS